MRARENGQVTAASVVWLLLGIVLCSGIPAALAVVLGRRDLDLTGALVPFLLAALGLDALLLLVPGRQLAAGRVSGTDASAGTVGYIDRSWRACLVVVDRFASGSAFYRRWWEPTLLWLTPLAPVVVGYRLAELDLHHRTGALAMVIALAAIYFAVPGILRGALGYARSKDEPLRHTTWFIAYGLAWMGGIGAWWRTQARAALLRSALGPGSPRGAPEELVEMSPVGPPADSMAAEPATTVDLLSGPIFSVNSGEASPVSAGTHHVPEAQRIADAAQRLPAIVETLVREVEQGREECRRLAARIEALECASNAAERGIAGARLYATNTIDPEGVRRLGSTLERLQAHPDHVLCLVSLSEQSSALVRVVEGYARLRAVTAVK